MKVLLTIWHKTRTNQKLTITEKIIFYILCLFEPAYRLVFFVVMKIKKFFGNKKIDAFKIISVGNLSVGGTGKSVLVSFLINELTPLQGAIVMRGYKRKSKTNKSLLLEPSTSTSWQEYGDEAFMMCNFLQVPVVVGGNRYESCNLLKEKKQNIDFIILDDGYQNVQLQKNMEILLLDARWPFENGHCLPAGRLREKDLSRASLIAFSHADKISAEQRGNLRKQLAFDHNKIFFGKHECSGIFFHNTGDDCKKFLAIKSVTVFAGIGSISGFVQTVKDQGLQVGKVIEFDDHHDYTLTDVKQLLSASDVLVTTEKDWLKVKQLLGSDKLTDKMCKIYVLRVQFSFLSDAEKVKFIQYVSLRVT